MLKQIDFPNITIKMTIPTAISLMVLGGRKPSSEWLSSVSFYDDIWAVDRGLYYCTESGLIPDKLIGDGDSSDEDMWQDAKEKGVSIYKFNREKDYTDFQLSLNLFAEENYGKSLFLTGAMGGRFDHLWSVIISFLYFSKKYVPVGIADDREGIVFLKDNDALQIEFKEKPLALSLISFSERCDGVFVDGVKWPLTSETLNYSNPYSISNEVCENKTVNIKLEKGLLGVYWVRREFAQ